MEPARLSPEDAKAIQEVRESLLRTEALLGLPEFQWFLDECVETARSTARESALDTKFSMEDRDRAAHILKALSEVADWTKERHDSARETLKTMGA